MPVGTGDPRQAQNAAVQWLKSMGPALQDALFNLYSRELLPLQQLEAIRRGEGDVGDYIDAGLEVLPEVGEQALKGGAAVLIPGAKQKLENIITGLFDEIVEALASNRSVQELGDSAKAKFGHAAHLDSPVIPTSFVDPPKTAGSMRTFGGRTSSPKTDASSQLGALVEGNPRAPWRPRAQIGLGDPVFQSNMRNRLLGRPTSDEVISHEFGHILEQAIDLSSAKELTDQPNFLNMLDEVAALATRESSEFLSKGNIPHRFAEGLASFLELGQTFPQSVIEAQPGIEGLDQLILDMVKDLKR